MPRHFGWRLVLCLLAGVITSHLPTVSAVYDPTQPHTTENLDPAEADPSGNITCLGDRYAIDLPIIAGFNPNEVTMQQLCAKPQYNGGNPGEHVGGWCGLGAVKFDQRPAAEVNVELSNPRVLLGCAARCFCNGWYTELGVQSKGYVPFWEDYLDWPPLYDAIKIDILDDFEASGQSQVVSTLKTRILLQTQIVGSPDAVTVGIDENNEIQCRGTLPRFQPPEPYRLSDFTNLQQMCAVAAFGGN